MNGRFSIWAKKGVRSMGKSVGRDAPQAKIAKICGQWEKNVIGTAGASGLKTDRVLLGAGCKLVWYRLGRRLGYCPFSESGRRVKVGEE